MSTDAVDDIDEFDPLLLWRRAPALKPPLVETANDVIQWVGFQIAIAVATRVRVLRCQFRFGRIETNFMVQLRSL